MSKRSPNVVGFLKEAAALAVQAELFDHRSFEDERSFSHKPSKKKGKK